MSLPKNKHPKKAPRTMKVSQQRQNLRRRVKLNNKFLSKMMIKRKAKEVRNGFYGLY